MDFSAKSTEPPLAAEGGLAAPEQHAADPYAALDDLMAVVEALCPVRPERPLRVKLGEMLL